MIDELFKTNCIKIGNWKLKSGEISKYYFDIKNIISNPSLLKKIGDELYHLFDDFDIICGIPFGALPIASYISTQYNKPLIYIRNQSKNYGTEKLIEGTYSTTDKCVIIDDVITSGKSIEDAINILKNKVNIIDVAVVIDRQQNYACSLPVKSLFYKNDVIKYRLKNISIQKNSKLCFSADIDNPTKLLNILDIIGNFIVVCKIHFDIIDFSSYNRNTFKENLIKASIKYNFLLMEDRKFIDISHIVLKQYSQFCNWIDLVTVHSSVPNKVVQKLSGVLLVSNMSNNNFDFTSDAICLATDNPNNVVGFITQKRINCNDLICMTPGVSNNNIKVDDQKYRTINDIDTDYYIVGRALYNSTNIKKDVLNFITPLNI